MAAARARGERMKMETSIVLAMCATLVLPACRNDERTEVPDTRTPYMDEAPDEDRAGDMQGQDEGAPETPEQQRTEPL
jgi:hypothetical protein